MVDCPLTNLDMGGYLISHGTALYDLIAVSNHIPDKGDEVGEVLNTV